MSGTFLTGNEGLGPIRLGHGDFLHHFIAIIGASTA
jgi:hypothetical protein